MLAAFPDAYLEDPHDLPEIARRLGDHVERVSYDAPIHSAEDIGATPLPARVVNVKPSRIGSLRALFEVYARCARERRPMYGGGMGELGVGRGQIELLAALFHADAPDDVAPSAYNEDDPTGELPASPLAPRPDAVGFRWTTQRRPGRSNEARHTQRKERTMSLTRVQNFSISLDGFGTGEPQSQDAPFGHAGERLHEWMFATRWGARWSASPAAAAASTTPSRGGSIPGSAPRSWVPGSSARPDGTRTRSGRAGGAPTRRSTHRPSSSPITRAHRSRWRAARRSTSSTLRPPRRSRRPARLRTARTSASAEVPPMVRDFLAAGLVDHMHIVVVPILLGRGVRLWDGLEGLEKGYEVEATSSPSGVTHVTFTRAGV